MPEDRVEFFPEPGDHFEPEEFEQPQPVWAGSPDDILPGVAPVELLLGRSARAAVLLSGARVYPSGIEFNIHVRIARGVSVVDHRDLAAELLGHGVGDPHEVQPRRLREDGIVMG
jgi:hypothetical protein